MSGPYAGPGRETHQSSCPLTPGRDLSAHSSSSRRHDHRIGLTMSAAASSLKHASIYGFTQRDHSSSSSSSSSYSPLRRLQHLTTMVSQPDLVLPVREPERSWEWGMNKKERGKEKQRDSWADCTSSDYRGTHKISREESFGSASDGQKQPVVQTGSRDTPAANQSDPTVSEKKTEGCFSGPPSPAFSLDSNSPFANGFLHFESSLFEDDDNDGQAVSPMGGLQDKHENTGNLLQSTPKELSTDSKDVTLSSAKVVTRSQSSGQRRRYWDGSDDEWESDTELLLLDDSLSRPSTQNNLKKKSLPPVKFLEGEVIWAKFNRRPWWPCEVIVDPTQGIYHRVKEPSDRPCRLYHVRTFGEPVELTWVEDKATNTFHGGFEFEQLCLLRRRGKQKEQNFKYTIAKRFQNSWKSSVAEAESVLQERPKMTSSNFLSLDETFHENSKPEIVNKANPTFPSSPSPTFPETSHLTNGSVSSPVTPAKPSTLRKSPGKKKPTKLSKEKSKHTIKTLRNSPDQPDRDNGECPYSDLDSVPKILCPKALERQPKLVPPQPTVSVVKEAKKQPEIQSGLWFSKSGKDRRPKTSSPMPDRTLFSKVPCKKKSSSVVSKKTLVPSASASNGGQTDQPGLTDKPKTLAPPETNLPSEESGYLKCKNTLVANRPFGSTGSLADQSGSSEKQKSLVSVETGVPSKCGHSKGSKTVSNTTDTVTGTASDQGSSSVKKALEPSTTVSSNDQSRLSESVKSISQTEHCDNTTNKKVYAIDKNSDQAEEEESNKTPASSLNNNTTDPLARLEKHASLVSKCRLPFVKLIRKDIKGKRFLNSSLTVSPTDDLGCTKNEKTPHTKVTEIASQQSDYVDGKTSVSTLETSSPESVKVSVKKVKASTGSGILRLSSDSSQGAADVASNVASVSNDLGSPGAERILVSNISPNNKTYSSSNQSDQEM
uniref:uncharacterized protein n=1 Tax=Semicossyphus pulcher TaxID=241346 RepID=UPI0037E70687